MALILPLAASNDRETQLPVDLNDNHATPPVAPDGEDIGREASPVSSESSDTDRQILPGLGAFVVFSIDPVASLDADVLDDPEAIAACNKLVNKKYVALADRNGFYNPWEPYNECIAQLILQGEPRSSPECGMEPSMSVPIIPMTIQDHPSGRAPLKPSNPLPWKDCYISSFFVVTVRSPTLFTQEPIQCMLDTKELTRRLILIGKDVQQKRNADRREAAAQIPVQSASLPDEVTSDSGPIRSADKSSDEDDDPADRVAGLRSAPSMHASETESESHRSYSTRGGGDGDEDSFDALFSEKLAPQGMITVHFSHDLSTVKQLHPPEEYYEEVNAIKR
ncbi:hypothetical protein DFH06DRAFT_1008699 [Mycena polygramma]|nr:hypothetical protein DFH06DRAFT_1008699 [Mycena polygramma]